MAKNALKILQRVLKEQQNDLGGDSIMKVCLSLVDVNLHKKSVAMSVANPANMWLVGALHIKEIALTLKSDFVIIDHNEVIPHSLMNLKKFHHILEVMRSSEDSLVRSSVVFTVITLKDASKFHLPLINLKNIKALESIQLQSTAPVLHRSQGLL